MTDAANGAAMTGKTPPESADILIVDDNKANLQVLSGMLGERAIERDKQRRASEIIISNRQLRD